MQSVKDKLVLVTGGTSGMGLETAKKLTEMGARVIIAARREEALKAAQQETGALDYVVLDVTEYGDWEKARDAIVARYGCPDILLNNAGQGVAIIPFLDYSMEQIERAINVNLYGPIYGCRVFAPLMKERRSGLIVNVLSVCASHAWKNFAMYSAAKAGLRMFAKCLYLELQPYGVRVTSFIPGGCNTNFGVNAGQKLHSGMKFDGANVADAISAICQMDDYTFVEELTLWGTEQTVEPL